MAGKSTIQTILENVRDAGAKFGHRFTPPPANVVHEVGLLLGELGVSDPVGTIKNALAGVATDWHAIADQLGGISLDFTDPAALLAGIQAKGKAIETALDDILHKPDQVLNGLGLGRVAQVMPKRLLDYIVYEFLTATHEKIAGIFLLLGVLRREHTPSGGDPAFVTVELRVFDLDQLIRAITHPRESFLTVMRWGTNDFIDRPLVDGMALLFGTIPGTTRGSADDTFPVADERNFVPVDAGVHPAARRTLTTPAGTLSFVGLHKHGIGLEVPNPIQLGGNLIPAPPVPAAQIFAVVPGPVPASDPPGFKVLP